VMPVDLMYTLPILRLIPLSRSPEWGGALIGGSG
jgi:hypothetical protein